jgi:hypothetical protein
VFIALNGQRIRSKEGASLDTGGLKRDAQTSDAGVDGFSESVTAPTVDCRINHTAATSLTELHAFKGTLTFETDTGRAYTLTNAWSSTPPKLEKGEVTLQFQATECIES